MKRNRPSWPPTSDADGRWTFQGYFDAVALGHIPPKCLAEYRRTNEFFDRWILAKTRRIRELVEGWRTGNA